MNIEEKYPLLYQLLGAYLNLEVFFDEEYSEKNGVTNFLNSSNPETIDKTIKEIVDFLKNSLIWYKEVVEITNFMIYNILDDELTCKKKVKEWLVNIITIIDRVR